MTEGSPDPSPDLADAARAVVYRSIRPADCNERAFVLTAVGIANTVGFDGEAYLVLVEESAAGPARGHLERYELEQQAAREAAAREALRPSPTPDSPHAWIGTLLYLAVLWGASAAIGQGIGPLDAFDRGELRGADVQRGEWWRAFTALTLHRDLVHLVGNMGFGAWISWSAARRLGPGLAWLVIVLAAALVNLTNASFGPAEYRSVGASTAVFAALGVIASVTWRERYASATTNRLRAGLARWSPFIAGVILLGWTGSEGENTDLVAHAFGLLAGFAGGWFVALARVRGAVSRVPQWVLGAAALALLAGAWSLAVG